MFTVQVSKSASLVLIRNYPNALQLQRRLPNPARNLAGAGLGRIGKNDRISDLPELQPKSGEIVGKKRVKKT